MEVRLAAGVPALTGEPLVDWPGLRNNARTIAQALDAQALDAQALDAQALGDGGAGNRARQVYERLNAASAALDRDALAQASLAGAWDLLADVAQQLSLDSDAFATVLDYAARPALRAGALAVRPQVAEARWSRGTCPACGAPPTLAVVFGKEHERQLQCGRCGTGWTFPRLRCPACGERDHERLGYLHAPGEGEYRRVEVCDNCHSYMKSIAALDAPDPDRLLELDLETAALDFAALERGYHRAATRA